MDFHKLFSLNKRIINIGGYVKSLGYFLLNRKYFTVVKRNVELFDKKKSDVCYICALGPSLKEVDLSKIEGDTIVVNDFYRVGREYPGFVPTFYLMIDALYKEDKSLKRFKDAIASYASKDTVYLLHPKLADVVENVLSIDHYYYLSCFKGFFKSSKTYRIDRVMPAFSNVACTAIACAIALRYKKIILLGCDFSSFASRTLDHCYAKGVERSLKLSYELYCYSFVADMHDELFAYAQKQNIEIINSTKGSLIDAYPYVVDDSLYK